jgi:hypothetical protein
MVDTVLADCGAVQQRALLAVYQSISVAIADATETTTGAAPDRAGFSIALQVARDQVVQAADVIAGTTIDLVGAIGRAVQDHLLPDRRPRTSPRAVKRPLSRYAYKNLRSTATPTRQPSASISS